MLALTSILDRTMPGIKKLLSGKRSDNPTKDKLSDFVEHYWHYDNITKLTESKFVESYQKWAKRKDTTQVSPRQEKSMLWQAVVFQHFLPEHHQPKCSFWNLLEFLKK